MTGPAERNEAVDLLAWDPSFTDDLVEICWQTGFMGESLAGTGRFDDKRLFAMLFALPWPAYEPDLAFLAVASLPEGRRAVGYIIGTSDSAGQMRDFRLRWMPRIALRLALLSWWRHPESAAQVLAFASSMGRDDAESREALFEGEPGGAAYPAHLHINILPAWQGRGLGGRLMEAFLSRLRERSVPGVFLETSDRNLKALPFYEKLGFRLVARSEGEFWKGEKAQGLTYAMRLDGGAARAETAQRP
jgi:ribosomal protein S18 acetylase RimI-like enzyme